VIEILRFVVARIGSVLHSAMFARIRIEVLFEFSYCIII